MLILHACISDSECVKWNSETANQSRTPQYYAWPFRIRKKQTISF